MKEETPSLEEEKTEVETRNDIRGLEVKALYSSPQFIREFQKETKWNSADVNDEVSNLLCDPDVSIYVK